MVGSFRAAGGPCERRPQTLTLTPLVQVREEQLEVRGSADAPVTGDNVTAMTYTRQVVREVLRYRPPAPMVPQANPQP